jgi:hypothetical protein
VPPVLELDQSLDSERQKQAACHDKASEQSVKPQGHEKGISGEKGGDSGSKTSKDAQRDNA